MSTLSSAINQSQISQLLQQQQAMLLQPVALWQSEIKTDQTQISAWGKVAGALSGLKSALAGINNPGSLDNRSVTTSASSVVTATAARGAASGTYQLAGVRLAHAQTLYSNAYASASGTLASSSGSLTLKFAGGSSSKITISKSEMTLNGIAQAINQAGAKVRASVVQTGGGAELTLQGTGTGSSNAFSVSGTGTLAQLDYGSASGSATGMHLAQGARNATFTVNGVPVSEQSNSVTGVISNVTLTLAGSGSAAVTVAPTSSKLSGALSSVITKLNSAVGTVAKETAYQPGSGSGSSQSSAKSGPLLGNVSAERIGNDLVSAVSGAYSGSMTASGIGITVSKTGSVSFDQGAFSTAYKQNPSAVESLVQQLFTRIDNVVGPATGGYASSAGLTYSGSGTVAAEKNALSQDIKGLNQQIQNRRSFVAQQMQTAANEYTQMEQALQASQVSAAYLSVFSGNGSGSSNGTGG